MATKITLPDRPTPSHRAVCGSSRSEIDVQMGLGGINKSSRIIRTYNDRVAVETLFMAQAQAQAQAELDRLAQLNSRRSKRK